MVAMSESFMSSGFPKICRRPIRPIRPSLPSTFRHLQTSNHHLSMLLFKKLCLLVSLFAAGQHKTGSLYFVDRQTTLITMSSERSTDQAASNSASGLDPNPLLDAMAGMQLSSQEDNDQWESVPAKTSKKNRRSKGNQFSQWSSPPLMVEPIPPTPQTTNFTPFMILLMGLPGSGKSTFSNLLMEAMPYKFARVNQDQLGSRQKCVKAANEALDENRCVILDRCNFDAAQRATWFDLCKKRKIAIHGIALQVPKQLCIQRCQGRGAHETVAPEDAVRVVNLVAKGFQLPSPQEKEQFQSYRLIVNSGMLDDALVQFLNQNE